MYYPAIVITHKLPNRVRFKLSLPIKEIEEAKRFLVEYSGIDSFEYNPITRSILIYYDNYKVELNEIIMRLSIIYSKQYEMAPVNVFIPKDHKNSSLAYFAITNIIVAALVKSFTNFKSKEIVNFLSWLAIGSTTLAILDHGYKEVSERGSFDPELVSSVYLLNAVRTGNLITGSLITWLAAFGRHIVDLPYEGITIKVKKYNNLFTGQPQYNISIFEGARVNDPNYDNKVGVIRDLLSKYIGHSDFKFKKNYYMGNNEMIDSKDIGASELLGDNIIVNNKSGTFSI